jgi:hypothetical protein
MHRCALQCRLGATGRRRVGRRPLGFVLSSDCIQRLCPSPAGQARCSAASSPSRSRVCRRDERVLRITRVHHSISSLEIITRVHHPSYYQRLLLVTATRVLSDPHVQGVVASSAVADRFSYTGRWRETLSAQACREGEGNVSRTDCYWTLPHAGRAIHTRRA